MASGYIDYLNIRTCIARLWAEIYTDNNLNLHDSNIYTEDIICKLLNLIFDFKLINGNINKKNQKGFDLIDKNTKKIVQVSSTITRENINHSLKMSDDISNNCNGYDFIFVGLSFEKIKVKERYKNVKKNIDETFFFQTQNICFRGKEAIYNLNDLVELCYRLNDEKKALVSEMLQKEYGLIKNTKKITPKYPSSIDELFDSKICDTYESKDVLKKDVFKMIDRLKNIPIFDRQILFIFINKAVYKNTLITSKFTIRTNNLYHFCNEIFEISYEYLMNELEYLYEKRLVCNPDWVEMSLLSPDEKLWEKLLSVVKSDEKENYLDNLIVKLDFSSIK